MGTNKSCMVNATHKSSSQSSAFLLQKNKVRIQVLLKWIIAGVLSFVLIAVLYTLFLGRYTFIRNESIYRGYHFVGKPQTVHLFSNEGYGVTSFGNDGLVVNKVIHDDVPRVLFLGDSFVEANHVSDEYKFTEIIEKRWNKEYLDNPIQTLNLGLSAIDLRTHLQFAQDIDAHFSPSLVIILLDDNDFRVISQNPDMLTDIENGRFDNLVRRGREPVGNQLLYRLGIKSFAVRLKLQTRAFTNNPKIETAVPMDEGAVQAAYQIQLSALRKVWGERLVIIQHEHVNNFGQDDFVRTDTILAKTIRTQKIPVIDLYGALSETTKAKQPPYGFNNSTIGEGHFNRRGHEIVADEVLRYLESVSDIF